MSKEDKKHATAEIVQESPPVEGEIIHAPRGAKRGRFILTFLIAVMVLTTFSISGPVVDFFTGKAHSAGTYLSFKHPTLGTARVNEAEFVKTKQDLGKMEALLGMQRDNSDSDDDTARFIVFDSLAQAAGIEVTDKELGEQILARFGSTDAYRSALKQMRISTLDFERTLKRQKRFERFIQLTASPVYAADPEDVARLWRARHQEYAFDYVELPVDSLKAEASAQIPATDELKKWFDGLSEFEKNKHLTQDRARAEIMYRTLGPGVKAPELVAKYLSTLPAEKQDPEARAKDYYEGFRHVRFVNADYKPAQGAFDIEQYYQKFEDVHDQCVAESEVYECLGAWIADMLAREGQGEVIDFMSEGRAFGLGLINSQQLQTRNEFAVAGVPGYGRDVADVVFRPELAQGKVYTAPIVEKESIVVLRLVERETAHMPEFAVIEAQVKEDWVQKKAQDLALAKLEKIRDALGTRPADGDPAAALWRPEVDLDAFTQAVQAADAQVQRRDFVERTQAIKPGETPTSAQTFFQQSALLYTMKERSVAKAELGRDNKNAYLVRIAGIRDADVAKMTPQDFQTFSSQAINENARAYVQRLFTDTKKYLQQQYDVHLRTWDEEAKTPGA